MSSSEFQAGQPLEWNRFLRLAETQARTEPGKWEIEELQSPETWAGNLVEANALQAETHEISGLLDRDGLWGPLTDLTDPDAPLEALERGSVLETSDLAIIRRWLYAVDSWAQTPRDEIRGERFRKAVLSLPDSTQPIRIIDRVLTPEGEISERATPRLLQLHNEIRGLKKDIHFILDGLVKTLSARGVLQENFTDVRDGRFVIPVKISAQNEIEGIIYEASASRQTVFVEPREVAVLNNRLRQRQNDLIQEVFAVLQDTSQKLQPFVDEINSAVDVLAHWDAVQARARLGQLYGGKTIEVTAEREFRLEQTAHPLLWWSMNADQVVRNEMDFGEPTLTLLLTGPNTGGKTVLLKTLGLAGLCARTGFPFPATGTPVVPFFDDFFVDLGDSQSIEEHLSSFSGHVLRFKEILENVTSQSLVLIDELNSATDPEEGAALGRAFLETLMAKGAMIVSTTHDPHLKALAISDERIMNASMAFDESRRTPTYTMVLGVPGRSRALETAERLGLPREVLDLAKKYLSSEHLDFENTLATLERDLAEATRARKDAERIREEAEKMKKEWTERTESSVNEMLERTRQKLRRILEQAQDEVRDSVRKLDEMKNRRELDTTRSGLNLSFTNAASRIDTALEEEAPEIAEVITLKETHSPPASTPDKLAPGSTVRIPKWKSMGQVLEIVGNKAKVQMGSIQMQLSVKDIEPLNSTEAALHAKTPQAKLKKSSGILLDRPATPAPKIDLRGQRLDEAMSDLETYVDQAFRSGGLAEITVIHGLGTGAIREGVRKLLKGLPYIKEFRDGGAGHGGTGATIVEFERD